MKKNILLLIFLLMLVGTGLLIYQKVSGRLNLSRTTAPDYGNSIVFVDKADRYIRQNRLDSAIHYLDLIIAQRTDSTISSQLLDTAQALRWQIKQINLLDTGNIYIGVLLDMPDQEYQDFLNKRLHKSYLGHPELNNLFLNKLYFKNQNWDQATAGLRIPASGLSRQNAADAIAMRKEYAETIKSSFLNLGFDISVEISGIDNTKLTLTASEFNDEWFEKFESDSAMSEWHNLGFTQVEIRSTSGYSKVKTW